MAGEGNIHNFIDGQFVPSELYLDSYDPSVGKVWAKIPDSSDEEVDKAVTAARKAFPLWSAKSAEERSKLLMKIADLIERDLEEFAELESRDQGKPVSLARTVDIPRAALNFRFFASVVLHHTTSSSNQALPGSDFALNYVHQEPVGVAGLIVPWNLPLYLLSFKMAPAIATGNTVVAKPSEMTSVTTDRLCKLFVEAGLPPGVVNVVYGTGPRAGAAIVRHPDVERISFTGSTNVGILIQQMAAPFVKKISLELGGKNAAVIFDDADMEQCLPTCVRSSFANQGEICLCTSRIFVQRKVYGQFVEKFVKMARAMKVGDPRAGGTAMGALVSREHLEKVRGYVRLGAEEGGTVQCGEGVDPLDLPARNQNGNFMRPTVITGVADKAKVMQEEIFGPVTCIVPFDTEEEVVGRVNDVRYGLCATVWTQNLSTAHRVSRKLQVGTCWVNCWLIRNLNQPFGGYKMSGIGREGAKESLDFFTEAKNVCIRI